mgnify:CR=1 FL=1
MFKKYQKYHNKPQKIIRPIEEISEVDGHAMHVVGWTTVNENNLIKETITPEFGNVVVLDFTENNVNHSVNRVLRDYGRNALISFVYKK